MILGRLATHLGALSALLLSGSVESARAETRPYPSLGRRAVEGRDRDSEIAVRAASAQAAADQPVPDDTALLAVLAGLSARATAASGAFDAQYGTEAQSVADAGAAPPGSEAWVVAERAISRLDAVRYDSVTALASLDSLYVERTVGEEAARARADGSAIDRERQRVVAMVDSQNDRLDALKAKLISP